MEKFIQDHLQYIIETRTRNGRTNIDNYLDEYLTKNNNNISNQNFLNSNLINYQIMNPINNMSNDPTIYNYFYNINLNRAFNLPLINQNNLNNFNNINSINTFNNYNDNFNIAPIKLEQEFDTKKDNHNSNNNNIKTNTSKEQILKILDALIKTTKKSDESNKVK